MIIYEDRKEDSLKILFTNKRKGINRIDDYDFERPWHIKIYKDLGEDLDDSSDDEVIAYIGDAKWPNNRMSGNNDDSDSSDNGNNGGNGHNPNCPCGPNCPMGDNCNCGNTDPVDPVDPVDPDQPGSGECPCGPECDCPEDCECRVNINDFDQDTSRDSGVYMDGDSATNLDPSQYDPENGEESLSKVVNNATRG